MNADFTPNGNFDAQLTDPTERTVEFSPITDADCNNSNPDGSAFADYAIMITNQHAEDKNNNYAIANYGGVDNVFTITIDGSCNDYGFTEHDSNQATMVKLENAPADKCVYQVTVKNPAAQLFYFQGSIDVGIIDFFNGIDVEQA